MELVLERRRLKTKRKKHKEKEKLLSEGEDEAVDGDLEQRQHQQDPIQEEPTVSSIRLGTNDQVALSSTTSLYMDAIDVLAATTAISFPAYQTAIYPELEHVASAPEASDIWGDEMIQDFQFADLNKHGALNTTVPPLDLGNQLDFHNEGLDALPEDALEEHYFNQELVDHAKLVDEFHSTQRQLPTTNDDFFRRVEQYENSCQDTMLAKVRLKNLISSSQSLSHRVWVVRREAKQVSGKCHDGFRVAQNYTSETASLNEEDFKRLTEVLEEVQLESQHVYGKATLNSKLSRLWIQNSIDVLLMSFPNEVSEEIMEDVKYRID
ncbi:hypothetical protein HDV05_005492, partial [Chytridiales sp. JEL 0842]